MKDDTTTAIIKDLAIYCYDRAKSSITHLELDESIWAVYSLVLSTNFQNSALFATSSSP